MAATHDILFARDFPPMDGGIARVTGALAAGYPTGELVVSTGDGDASGTAARGESGQAVPPVRIDRVSVPVDRLRTLGGRLKWSRRAVTLAREPGARIAWCDTIRPAGYVAYWANRRTGLPYGIMVVGNDVLTLRAKLATAPIRRRIMRHVLDNAAVFVANSGWTAARLRELLAELHLDSAALRVRVVPLGTYPSQFRADPSAATSFRIKRHLPAGRWLVTVARLVDYKGMDTVIALLPALVDSYPDLHYAVVGRGPDCDRLLALAAALGVDQRLHILNDVADTDLVAAYGIGTIYVGLTRETNVDVEGFGISFAEAAACGLPVVATRSGGIPDAVVDGRTGLLCEQHDIAAIDGALRSLLDNAALARKLGDAGRARVENYLNWERVVNEMRGIAEEFSSKKRDGETVKST